MLIPSYGFVTYEDDKNWRLHQYKSQIIFGANEW